MTSSQRDHLLGLAASEASATAAEGSGRGRKHGTSSSEPFDRWFRYPAGFASDYVALLLERLKVQPRSIILDPFTGSGVTGTAARGMGHSFYGIEAHPLIAELASLKFQPAPAPVGSLTETAQRLATLAASQTAVAQGQLEEESELVLRCFAQPVLAQLVALRNIIRNGEGGVWDPHVKWALLGTLRDVATARVGWPYQRPGQKRQPRFTDALARFCQRATWMAEDLHRTEALSDSFYGEVTQGDARSGSSWAKIESASAHGCVSSPPYLNNFDYADATRLELYFWGEVKSWAQMCSDVRSDMLVATTQQSSVGNARSAQSDLKKYSTVGEEINDIASKLQGEREKRERGKEYDRVIPAYFLAIAQVLENLSSRLVEGAPTAWLIGDSAPYGIYVDTPTLIGRLAEQFGFEVEQDRKLRARGKRWGTNATRHQVELSERLLLLRRRS
nr:DNA methyltransferase [Streptomyces sp. SID5789]